MFDSSSNMKMIKVLEHALDTATLRQEVISDNIANVNTPGFKRSSVSFEWELREALKGQPRKLVAMTNNPRHIKWGIVPDPTTIKPKTYVEYDTWLRNDGNNVDINKEESDLAKNSIMYEAITTRVRDSFRMLMDVIKGGR